MRRGIFVESKKVALITGVTGQDGSYLSELLLKKGYEVHGVKRRSSSFNTLRVDHIYEDPHLDSRNFFLHYGDVTDSSNLHKLIRDINPDEIYNLAAQSHVHVSFETPEYTANADALGPLRILEAVRLLAPDRPIKFYQASTSEMFGISNGSALTEDSIFSPRSPYAIAKLYGYWITKNYREAYGMFASNGILFNHESPRRGETFVTKKVVDAAVKISRGSKEVLYLGNLDAVRDWGHAKDFVEGMWLILQHSESADWVLATGEAISVREFVEKVFRKLGIFIEWRGKGLAETGHDQNGNTLIAVDPRYLRPTEVTHLLGDASKARRELGWMPRITLDELITEMVSSQIDK
jgi:GDPmannose 4,6-dehydratase